MLRQQDYRPVVIDTSERLPGLIQLDSMNAVQAKLAEAFLKSQLLKPMMISFADSVRVGFIFGNQFMQHTIRFSKELFRYCSKKDKSIRYAVKGPLLGEGSYGAVYQVTQTFKINHQGIAVCKSKVPEKWRAIKVFKGSEGIMYSTQEYSILRLIRSMRAKKNEISPSLNFASLLMVYIPGEDLFQCLLAHKNHSKHLSVLQRLVLSRELFAALHRDVHQNNIIHRDVKIENIRVSFKADGSVDRVTYVDFNLAKTNDSAFNGLEDVGSPPYASPEAFEKKFQNEKSDIYSLGRVLWCVWGLKLDFTAGFSDWDHFKTAISSLTDLPFLFSDVPAAELSSDHRKRIHDILFAINHNPQNERPDALAVIQIFDDIIAEYKRALIIREMDAVMNKMSAEAIDSISSAGIKLQDEPVASVQMSSIYCRQSTPLLFSPSSAANPAQSHQAAERQCVLF